MKVFELKEMKWKRLREDICALLFTVLGIPAIMAPCGEQDLNPKEYAEADQVYSEHVREFEKEIHPIEDRVDIQTNHDLPFMALGRCNPETNVITIDPSKIAWEWQEKLIVWHEIGHCHFGLRHKDKREYILDAKRL